MKLLEQLLVEMQMLNRNLTEMNERLNSAPKIMEQTRPTILDQIRSRHDEDQSDEDRLRAIMASIRPRGEDQ